jgi:hypothetical protein
VAAVSFFNANPVIVMPDFPDFTRDDLCQAFAAITIAAAIAKRKT